MNDPGKIRNIALVGHRGTGKTSLLEALSVSRRGGQPAGQGRRRHDRLRLRRRREEAPAQPLRQRWRTSSATALTFNLIDTPGDSSFLADTIAALARGRDGGHGRQLGARRRGADRASVGARRRTRPGARALSATCSTASAPISPAPSPPCARPSASRSSPCSCPSAASTSSRASSTCCSMKAYTRRRPEGRRRATSPPSLPMRAAELRDTLTETVAETDDELIEKYLEGEEISDDELQTAFTDGRRRRRKVFPVAAGSGDAPHRRRPAARPARAGARRPTRAGAAS